jgi:hypothetical protein
MAQMQGEIKRNIASLFGGIVVAGLVFVLWLLVTGELGYSGTNVALLGAVVAVATGGYVRLADL